MDINDGAITWFAIKQLREKLASYKELSESQAEALAKNDALVEELNNRMLDVIKVLDLPEDEIELHKELGTPPADLVRLRLVELGYFKD